MAAMVTGIVYDPESRGFQNGLEACCGTGKPYNYDPRVPCGTQRVIRGRNLTARACSNPKHYVSWDGIHTTEAFNKAAIHSVLSGHYIEPQTQLGCRVNFSEF
ncbi:GDSL esterase/lipase At1g54790 [Selaginella moellendorffii]|nr:GDSL esterase/lipase At1g54790 [Selaginella moellendorffii]|eukprot:XP_024518519.1 GDSL esterase/lipase At1g54790 [Selaginella moellendorffii]